MCSTRITISPSTFRDEIAEVPESYGLTADQADTLAQLDDSVFAEEMRSDAFLDDLDAAVHHVIVKLAADHLTD